jgi:predicted glycosyltransferase
MDESARQGMIRDGIPEERITIVGHPSLSRMRKVMVQPNEKKIAEVRKRLKLSDNSQFILFVSEPFSHYYGDEVGFTELTVLRELLSYFQERLSLMNKADNFRLVIKLHPKNSPDVFSSFKKEFIEVWKAWSPIILTDEIDKVSLLMASDLVIGMVSIMLMESVALGRPTVSIQVGAKKTDLCEAVNQGIIPYISTRDEMRQLLDRLLDNPYYKEQYTDAIRNYPIIEDAETLIWEQVESRRL